MSNLNLSVVILSYNTKDVTGRCLAKALAAKEYCEKKLKNKVEVIVLDNASADGSALAIKKDFPKVKLIAQKENLGFAKGNNLVMQKIKNPFILLLNSDCYLQEESLYKAIAYFRVNLNCDVLGARLNYASGLLQPSAGSLPNILNIIFWILGLSLLPFFNMIVSPFHPKEKKYFAKAHKTGWIMGAFFMLKKKVYDVTGGFDENFFMYKEDIDLSWRLRLLGWSLWCVLQAKAYHARTSGGTGKSGSYVTHFLDFIQNEKKKPDYVRGLSMKNQWLLLIKNLSSSQFFKWSPFILWREFQLLGINLLFSPGILFRHMALFFERLRSTFTKRGIILGRVSYKEVADWWFN